MARKKIQKALKRTNGLLKVQKRSCRKTGNVQPATGKCALLALSAELRNRIYQYTLVNRGDTRIKAYGSLGPKGTAVYDEYGPKEPALLRTCRQIRQEATAIYYGNNFFWTRNSSDMVFWLQLIGEERRAMLGWVVPWDFKDPMENVAVSLDKLKDLQKRLRKNCGIRLGSDVIHYKVRSFEGTIWLVNESSMRAQMTKADRKLYRAWRRDRKKLGISAEEYDYPG